MIAESSATHQAAKEDQSKDVLQPELSKLFAPTQEISKQVLEDGNNILLNTTPVQMSSSNQTGLKRRQTDQFVPASLPDYILYPLTRSRGPPQKSKFAQQAGLELSDDHSESIKGR